MNNIFTRKRFFFILVGMMGVSITTFSSQLTLRTWTGIHGNQYADSTNWSPMGLPRQTDSVVIPATSQNPEISNPQSPNFGSLHILGGATLSFKNASIILQVQGPIVIDSSATLQINENFSATTGDIIVNGSFNVNGGKAPQFLCRGNLILGTSAIFSKPGENLYASVYHVF